jgi:hypothetical protein
MEACGFVTLGGRPLDSLTFRFPAMVKKRMYASEKSV